MRVRVLVLVLVLVLVVLVLVVLVRGRGGGVRGGRERGRGGGVGRQGVGGRVCFVAGAAARGLVATEVGGVVGDGLSAEGADGGVGALGGARRGGGRGGGGVGVDVDVLQGEGGVVRGGVEIGGQGVELPVGRVGRRGEVEQHAVHGIGVGVFIEDFQTGEDGVSSRWVAHLSMSLGGWADVVCASRGGKNGGGRWGCGGGRAGWAGGVCASLRLFVCLFVCLLLCAATAILGRSFTMTERVPRHLPTRAPPLVPAAVRFHLFRRLYLRGHVDEGFPLFRLLSSTRSLSCSPLVILAPDATFPSLHAAMRTAATPHHACHSHHHALVVAPPPPPSSGATTTTTQPSHRVAPPPPTPHPTMGMALGKITVETPAHTVVHTADAYQIWRYPPTLAATVTASDLHLPDAATEHQFTSAAFRALARYIGVFGTPENRAPSPHPADTADTADTADNPDQPEAIAMTAPVELSPRPVAMTAPVVMTPRADAARPRAPAAMSFFLPRAYAALADAPVPTNAAVKLARVPERYHAVVQYSGNLSMHASRDRADALLDRLRKDGVHVVGDWSYCGYNPPITLPWLKRNEVHVPVDGAPFETEQPE